MYEKMFVLKNPFFNRQVFCDFGENFVITDSNGEQPGTNMVADVDTVSIV